MVADFAELKTNAEIISKEINKAMKKNIDMRVPFGLIARSQFKFERALFLQTTGPGKFEDFKGGQSGRSATSKFKDVGFKYPILFRTGRLGTSLLQPGGENILNIQPDVLQMGTRVPYSKFHQFGTSRMAARPFLFVDNQRRKAWTKIIRTHSKKAFKQFDG